MVSALEICRALAVLVVSVVVMASTTLMNRARATCAVVVTAIDSALLMRNTLLTFLDSAREIGLVDVDGDGDADSRRVRDADGFGFVGEE